MSTAADTGTAEQKKSRAAGAAGTTADQPETYAASGAAAGTTGNAESSGNAESTGSAENANTISYADQINAQYDALDRQAAAEAGAKTAQSISDAESSAAEQLSALREQYRELTGQQAQALDNQILTDQLNGRYGGIAGANLSAAAESWQSQRNELSREQLALAASTARQVEQLRAQGEFDRADALLQSSQQRLRMLYEDAVRVQENTAANAQYFQQQALAQQQAEAQRQSTEASRLQEQGWLLLQYGVVPPENMLAAMGIDAATAKALAQRGLIATNR